MDDDTREPAGTRGGAPEALRDVLARSFAMLLSRVAADGGGSAEGPAADGGDAEECVSGE